jgi:DNA-binding MarR family transcriptional regulator
LPIFTYFDIIVYGVCFDIIETSGELSMVMPDGRNKYLDVLIAIRRANETTYRVISEAVRKHGCSREQFEVLWACQLSARPVTPAELSRWTFRQPHSVVGLLNRMEKQGLIERRRNDSGPKRTLVSPTQKGREIINVAYPAMVHVVTQICQQFPENEMLEFALFLNRVHDAALEELKTSVHKRTPARHKRNAASSSETM